MDDQWYEVRFRCYQYNSGAADSGERSFVREFKRRKEAFKFEAMLKDAVNDVECARTVAREFLWYDGYLTKVIGIFKVSYSEEKVS